MSEDETGRSMLRIALAGLARAPRRSKLALAANVLLLVAVGATILMDVGTGDSVGLRAIATTLIMGGALLLSFASVLWAMSQSRSCSFLDMKREAFNLRAMRARKLDEVLIAFPVFAFIAGCMMAAGLGVFASVITKPLAQAMLAGMALWFFYWTTSMIAATTRFLYTHAREQAAAAERARGEATESQLAALQAQMNPHFLFNTLNTVASLVRTNAPAAEATVENLAVVLRRTLDRSRRVLSSVDDEIDHLAAYISVAQQRFEDRLKVHWSVDPKSRDLLLPTMTLQPLVENALKHGIGAQLEGGALHIGVHVEDEVEDAADTGRGPWLVLEVADDGPGFARNHKEGTGLSNLRARLSTLYGNDASLRICRSRPGSRVVVTVPVVHSAEEIAAGAVELPTHQPVAVETD